MKNVIKLLCFLIVLLNASAGFAQGYKTGDKVEALINNTWQEVTIEKILAGKTVLYQVKETGSKNYRGAKIELLTVGPDKLRVFKQQTVAIAATGVVPAIENNAALLGRYELYAGIPSMYLGHFILLGNGKYKVAFNTDEENYDETGMYIFHNNENTIEWLSGMFKNNNWGGKLVRKENGYSIEFSKTTFANRK